MKDFLLGLVVAHSFLLAGGLWINHFVRMDNQHQIMIKMIEICRSVGKEPYMFEGVIVCYQPSTTTHTIIP